MPDIIKKDSDRTIIYNLLEEIKDRSLRNIFRDLLLFNRVDEVENVLIEHRPEERNK